MARPSRYIRLSRGEQKVASDLISELQTLCTDIPAKRQNLESDISDFVAKINELRRTPQSIAPTSAGETHDAVQEILERGLPTPEIFTSQHANICAHLMGVLITEEIIHRLQIYADLPPYHNNDDAKDWLPKPLTARATFEKNHGLPYDQAPLSERMFHHINMMSQIVNYTLGEETKRPTHRLFLDGKPWDHRDDSTEACLRQITTLYVYDKIKPWVIEQMTQAQILQIEESAEAHREKAANNLRYQPVYQIKKDVP